MEEKSRGGLTGTKMFETKREERRWHGREPPVSPGKISDSGSGFPHGEAMRMYKFRTTYMRVFYSPSRTSASAVRDRAHSFTIISGLVRCDRVEAYSTSIACAYVVHFTKTTVLKFHH